MDSINTVRIFCRKSVKHLTRHQSPCPLSFSGFDTFCQSWTHKNSETHRSSDDCKEPYRECRIDNPVLNRFGHGLSYSQVEEVETALAEMQITKQQNGFLVPSVCYPNVPAVFCWDNNDLQEETLSGKV